MSRSYDFAVEVSPVTEDQAIKVQNVVGGQLGAYSVDYFHNGDTAAIDGSCTLCGGQSDDEAHAELLAVLRKEFPTLTSVTSYWRCTEYEEWDDSFNWQEGDDDDDGKEEIEETLN
jgi:hypothetical protein